MAGVRVTTGGVGQRSMSRVPGTPTGLQINTFALQKLKTGLTSEMLAPIVLEAAQPAYLQALAEWPVYEGRDHIGGASRDSIEVGVIETTDHAARVALTVGGPQLIADPRNRSHKDYAPYVEFNGTSKTPAGTLTHAVFANQDQAVAYIHEMAVRLIEELASGQ